MTKSEIKNLETVKAEAAKIIATVDELLAVINKQAEAVVPAVTTKEITLDEVRKELTTLSRNGHTKEVKDLLTKYGAAKLSDIKPEDYANLLKDAEVIANA